MYRRNWERACCDPRLDLLLGRTGELPDPALEVILDYVLGAESAGVV